MRPYAIDENNERYLDQGWGLAIRSSENTNRELCKRRSLRRSYEIIISRKYYSTEHDVGNRADTEKLLLEDLSTLYDDFCENLTLAAEKGLVQSIGDDGIESVFADNKPYYAIRLRLDVEYFRTP